MSDRYAPAPKMRVSITGLLRNSAEELNAVFRRNERARAEHDNEDCPCPACSDTDWTGFHAAGLEELANHLASLDANPALLFEFADLYALHGLAEAHQPVSLAQKTEQPSTSQETE